MTLLRRYLPKSLLWRTVLILVAPIMLFQHFQTEAEEGIV